jgi:pimeloyl-ACP methyl ester carboxylesterase
VVIQHAEPYASAYQFVQNGPVRLAVETLGPPDAPPILFLHGFPEHRGAWRAIARRLAKDYYCILPDLRGYGASDKPEDVSDYAVAALLTDVEALVNFAGTGRIAVAGHDWGGILAWWFTARFPERVERLIIANAPHPELFQRRIVDDPAQRVASQYLTKLRKAGACDEILKDGAPALWDRLFASNAAYTADQRTEYIAAWEIPGAMAAMLKWYQASPIVVPNTTISAEIQGWAGADSLIVHVPALIFWGLKDSVFMPICLNELQTIAPDHKVHSFEDGSHAIIHEKPLELAQALRSFLNP